MKKGVLRRLIACGIVVGLGFVALGAKLFLIQIRDRDRLVAYAERQLRRTLIVNAKRGAILDARGRPLAVSVEAPSLFANPQEVEDAASAARRLGEALDLPARDVRRKLTGGRRYVWLRRKIAPEQKRKVLGLGIEGLGFVTENRRFYPKRELASSLIGFVGLDEEGLAGVEQAYEGRLGGRSGRVRVERDARGRSIHPEASVLIPPRPGLDVRLTVDEVLQYIVEKELTAQLRQVGARRAIGVMVEPATGRILAMASVPGFNPNVYRRFGAGRWREAAVQEVYEPGSTFKLITAAAYLEAGGSLERRVFGEGGSYPIGVGRYTLRDHKKFGWMTAEEVIVHSSNIGTFKLAKEKVGPERLYEMARRFGIGRRTGVGFPGEAMGILRPPERWSGTSLAAVSIGQEVGVTPLQMVMVAAAIGNGGVMPAPRILEAVERKGEVVARAKARPDRRVVSPRVAALLARTMRKVVTEGSGARAEVPGYGAAGKTGTAQKIDPATRTYSETKFVMSFLGFVPYERPRIALLVLFDEGRGRGGAWGGTVAAPVWRRIAWQAMRYLRVPPGGAKVLTVARAVLPADTPSRGGGSSLGERLLRLAEDVRTALHGPPAPAR